MNRGTRLYTFSTLYIEREGGKEGRRERETEREREREKEIERKREREKIKCCVDLGQTGYECTYLVHLLHGDTRQVRLCHLASLPPVRTYKIHRHDMR